MPKRRIAVHEPETIPINGDNLVCGACLLDLFASDHSHVGVPSGCSHLFHWDCLESWAALQNTCPQCKNRFRMAGKYCSSDHVFAESVRFCKTDRLNDLEETESDAPIEVCEHCKAPGPDDSFILCDGMDATCNAMYHYKCMGFSSVPKGDWFCPDCTNRGHLGSPKKARPNLFPRSLVITASAHSAVSSGLPRNLAQPVFPNIPPTGSSEVSVFARFRQRRLEKKKF